MERKTEALLNTLFFTVMFAASFGYVEGAVAHYLRMHYYPEGFGGGLKGLEGGNTLIIEIGREAATMVMLTAVAALTGGTLLRKTAYFVMAFGIWDICYYGALKLFENWPQNLTEWDVLFLIPVPWFAPVLAPVIISVLGIAGALSVIFMYEKYENVKTGTMSVVFVCAGLLIVLASFFHKGAGMVFPDTYNWPAFSAGCVMIAAAFGMLFKKNSRRK